MARPRDPMRDLVAFVARHLTPDLADAALDGLRPADLYLACACARGSTAAINAFDRDYMREVDIALARMRIGPPRLNDVKQLVRQRLFVGGSTAKRADERRQDRRVWRAWRSPALGALGRGAHVLERSSQVKPRDPCR